MATETEGPIDSKVLLEVRNLRTTFATLEGEVPAVDGVDLEVHSGETLALVGESGCGKTVTALSIMRLLGHDVTMTGEIRLRDEDLLALPEIEMRKRRGNEIAIVFQEPASALNPVLTVGSQIGEVIRLHEKASKKEARQKTMDLLQQVGIQSPEIRIDEYPHQLSGGMRQRVMIAMALACHPALLIADEPTTALDVTIQAQILDLLRDLTSQYGMSTILITHDLGVVAEMADTVAVMYAGKVVECAPVRELFRTPKHPYTQGLFRSLPPLDRKVERLEVIPGNVPDPRSFPSGCRFHPRCRYSDQDCEKVIPPLSRSSEESPHQIACHHPL